VKRGSKRWCRRLWKERGGDIAEGKRTLITIELLERLSETDAERVRSILLAERETSLRG
jgi:geranylgeranyl pyrophosphate synthase